MFVFVVDWVTMSIFAGGCEVNVQIFSWLLLPSSSLRFLILLTSLNILCQEIIFYCLSGRSSSQDFWFSCSLRRTIPTMFVISCFILSFLFLFNKAMKFLTKTFQFVSVVLVFFLFIYFFFILLLHNFTTTVE